MGAGVALGGEGAMKASAIAESSNREDSESLVRWLPLSDSIITTSCIMMNILFTFRIYFNDAIYSEESVIKVTKGEGDVEMVW